MFFNHSKNPSLNPYDGKAIALDIAHHHAPFPQLFIIHEIRVRARYPFCETIEVSETIPWQDWILLENRLRSDVAGSYFNHQPVSTPPSSSVQPQQQQFSTQTSGTLSQGIILGLNDDVIAEILAASRASLSWRACQMEGTSWDGTADENRAKYMSLFGAENV